MAKDPYELLGVSQSADEAGIKKAYRQLAKRLHPDANPGDARAEARFKEVTAAYNLLSNPELKKSYDSGRVDATFDMAGFSLKAVARMRWRACLRPCLEWIWERVPIRAGAGLFARKGGRMSAMH